MKKDTRPPLFWKRDGYWFGFVDAVGLVCLALLVAMVALA